MTEGHCLKRPILVFCLWSVMISNALAEWHIEQITDRMTDRVFKYASTPAKEPSSRITADLHIGCFNARLYVAVQLSEKMPEGATISWRLDEQPVRYQPMPQVSSTSRSAIHDLNPGALRQAKRVRVQWAASTGTVLFYEFDVSGADKAILQIPCGNTPKN
ncbi:hypothetical protein [Bradyrhizobium sp. JYMT SZCCT0428]|uniref:hypothetical protein n=1 Tax=Bradyrhizobium sp. JYMT SZCCT0428 TaxID=2807673 RepID=UPI001BA5FEFA|nr:hypothetical protein [Bradyrhizobium sp. JYMT SZCCT0428]MBR1154614.1 hypothetical protein [Bradyrhizobium sp. JYMT SZCCT0428]